MVQNASTVERLFFYSVPAFDSTRFHDSVLATLKDSLALTLLHYLSLAGSLLWPPTSLKPILRYSPGDAVSLSVHESAADFHRLSGDHVREASESRPLVPILSISHERASVMALSVTLFPNSGFCIGISTHHGAFDGKSTTLFIKSSAHTCNSLVNGSREPQLPPELTPGLILIHESCTELLSNMNLLQACRVAPADSESPVTELTLPLTFFDLFWFKLAPVERLFFYSLPGLDYTRFRDSVLPALKDSLALTLVHYLPFAGNLLWPPTSPKPILRYSPGDAVSLSVQESSADFHRLSGDHVREAAESRPLVPSLSISHEQASVMALSVTLFPNSGFCIGISTHHGAFDGKSTTLFIKSWAHTCNRFVNGSTESQLPPELTPVFDRTAIEENPGVGGVDMVYLRQWMAATENLSEGNPRSLQVIQGTSDISSTDIVSGTFELTPASIEKLRNRVMKTEHSVLGSTRLSTFVLSSAYAFAHIVRALLLAPPGDCKKGIVVAFTADHRARLEVPVPANYIGNCVGGHIIEVEEKELMGFERVALKMSEMIREMDKGVLRGVEDRLSNDLEIVLKQKMIAIAGSNRFGVYGADFGWGRPEKVLVQSTERTGAISMAESRDGSGGVEIGVVLTKLQMQHFQSSFVDGLTSP